MPVWRRIFADRHVKINTTRPLRIVTVAITEIVLVVACMSASPAQDQVLTAAVNPAVLSASACAALRSLDFNRALDAPNACQIDSYLAPNVDSRLSMPPQGWNGKFVQGGCGGACGSSVVSSLCAEFTLALRPILAIPVRPPTGSGAEATSIAAQTLAIARPTLLCCPTRPSASNFTVRNRAAPMSQAARLPPGSYDRARPIYPWPS